MQSRNQGQLAADLGPGPFGTSDTGHAFVLKRLNPADDSLYVTGVPDNAGLMSYVQNFKNQRVFTGTDIPDFSGETWNMDIVLLAHPLICYVVRMWDTQGHNYYSVQLNPQLSSNVNSDPLAWTMDDYYAAMRSFLDQCEKYRVIYTGLTGNMVASDMYNAGSITAAQYAWEPADFSASRYHASASAVNITELHYPCFAFPDKLKSYTQLCQMPNCYSNDAKYGFYMPLKIYDNEYRRTNDLATYVLADTTDISFREECESTPVIPYVIDVAPVTQAPESIWFPIGGVNGKYLHNQLNLQYASYYMGQISIRNVSSQSQFYFTWRAGYQMVCTPGSMFTQYITAPIPYDVDAIVQYTQMCNYLQDAYPDVYNDWGLLKKKLRNAWTRIGPVVKFVAKAAARYYGVGV